MRRLPMRQKHPGHPKRAEAGPAHRLANRHPVGREQQTSNQKKMPYGYKIQELTDLVAIGHQTFSLHGGGSSAHASPQICRQISTLVPSSTTRLAGIWKKSEGLAPF